MYAIAGALLLITFVLFFCNDYTRKVFPSYNVQVCFLKSLSDFGPDNSHDGSFNEYINVTLTFLIMFSFLENVILILCIFFLRDIKNDFSIIRELQIVFITWFICNNAAVGLYVFDVHYVAKQCAKYFLLSRCLLTVMISTFVPIYQTYKGNAFIPIPPNRESIENIDMVLHIPIAASAFYEYLDQLDEDEEAAVFFALYADLRHYDKACINKETHEIKHEVATQIHTDYLTESAPYHVTIDRGVLNAVNQKFNDAKSNLNEFMFVELYAFVLDKLRFHFERFKRSPAFSALEHEIERQEKLYEVLVDASIITN